VPRARSLVGLWVAFETLDASANQFAFAIEVLEALVLLGRLVTEEPGLDFGSEISSSSCPRMPRK